MNKKVFFFALNDLFALVLVILVFVILILRLDELNLSLIKQSVMQSLIRFFNVNDADNPLINKHNFFYWEAMNVVQECWCDVRDEGECIS